MAPIAIKPILCGKITSKIVIFTESTVILPFNSFEQLPKSPKNYINEPIAVHGQLSTTYHPSSRCKPHDKLRPRSDVPWQGPANHILQNTKPRSGRNAEQVNLAKPLLQFKLISKQFPYMYISLTCTQGNITSFLHMIVVGMTNSKCIFFLSTYFGYFYQCIITFWCPRDSKGPI